MSTLRERLEALHGSLPAFADPEDDDGISAKTETEDHGAGEVSRERSSLRTAASAPSVGGLRVEKASASELFGGDEDEDGGEDEDASSDAMGDDSDDVSDDDMSAAASASAAASSSEDEASRPRTVFAAPKRKRAAPTDRIGDALSKFDAEDAGALAAQDGAQALLRRRAGDVARHYGAWEGWLECRVRLQRSLDCAARLPLPDCDAAGAGDGCAAALDGALGGARAALGGLLGALATQPSVGEDPTSADTKRAAAFAAPGAEASSDEWWTAIDATLGAKQAGWEANIERWRRRAELGVAAQAKKAFKVVDQSLWRRAAATLLDEDRALRKAHPRRCDLAAQPIGSNDGAAAAAAGGADAQKLATEVFDDREFYQQLLKAFVAAKSPANADAQAAAAAAAAGGGGRRVRRRVADCRASKGRKIKYDPIPKLANFMFPVGVACDVDVDELLSSLFGRGQGGRY